MIRFSRMSRRLCGMGGRFSASSPVVTSNGICLGTVCGLDPAPRDPPDENQIAMLDTLSQMVARFYEQPSTPDPAVAQRLKAITQDAQKEFMSLIGDETRTPRNGIHGMAQVLEPRDESDADAIDAVLSSAEHLNTVVASILSFTELSPDEIKLDDHPIDLDTLLQKVTPALTSLKDCGTKRCIGQALPAQFACMSMRQSWRWP